jgi:hypothetical protein
MQDCRLQLCGHSFVVRRHGADLQPAADHHYLDVKHLDVKHLDYDHYLDDDHHCHHPTLGVLHAEHTGWTLRPVHVPRDSQRLPRGRRSFLV